MVRATIFLPRKNSVYTEPGFGVLNCQVEALFLFVLSNLSLRSFNSVGYDSKIGGQDVRKGANSVRGRLARVRGIDVRVRGNMSSW